MKEIGLNKTGLNQLIREGYDLLKLDTCYIYILYYLKIILYKHNRIPTIISNKYFLCKIKHYF